MGPELALQLIEENRETHATTLDLSNCGMREIPPELTELVWLEELIIGNGVYYDEDKKADVHSANQGTPNVSSILPEGFGNLQQLKKLVIAGHPNQILRIENLSELARLHRLQFLYVRLTTLRNISPLANLINLQVLYFDSNQVSDISALTNLINLQVLNFSKNQVKNISPLANLINLQVLYFDSNQVSDISALTNLTNLQALYFNKNFIKNIAPLVKLLKLHALFFDENLVSDISPLVKLSNLNFVEFNKNLISNLKPLINLVSLNKFSCKGCPIEDCPADVYESGDPKQLKAYFETQNPATTEKATPKQTKIKKEDKAAVTRDVKLTDVTHSSLVENY